MSIAHYLSAARALCTYMKHVFYISIALHIWNMSCTYLLFARYAHISNMGWLRLVGSREFKVSFAEYGLFYRILLQKRPVICMNLLIVATPYVFYISIAHYLSATRAPLRSKLAPPETVAPSPYHGWSGEGLEETSLQKKVVFCILRFQWESLAILQVSECIKERKRTLCRA